VKSRQSPTSATWSQIGVVKSEAQSGGSQKKVVRAVRLPRDEATEKRSGKRRRAALPCENEDGDQKELPWRGLQS
jgi:hypothetical protein